MRVYKDMVEHEGWSGKDVVDVPVVQVHTYKVHNQTTSFSREKKTLSHYLTPRSPHSSPSSSSLAVASVFHFRGPSLPQAQTVRCPFKRLSESSPRLTFNASSSRNGCSACRLKSTSRPFTMFYEETRCLARTLPGSRTAPTPTPRSTHSCVRRLLSEKRRSARSLRNARRVGKDGRISEGAMCFRDSCLRTKASRRSCHWTIKSWYADLLS